MAKNLVNQWRHLLKALKYSMAGLWMAFREELAFRQEFFIFLIVGPAGVWLGKTGAERALLAGSWFFVMVVELANSAIESVVDRIGPEPHKLSGRAKDFGSASVFCAILLAVMIWVLVLIAH